MLNIPKTRAYYLVELLRDMEAELDRLLNIVETGTIRRKTMDFVVGDGYSTYWIADFVSKSKYQHSFISIDHNIDVCDEVLTKHGLRNYVSLIQGDSREVLKSAPSELDFVYLDSANNGDIIMEEFLLVEPKLSKTALVCVDDIDHKKGDKVLPYIAENGYDHYLVKNKMAVIYK